MELAQKQHQRRHGKGDIVHALFPKLVQNIVNVERSHHYGSEQRSNDHRVPKEGDKRVRCQQERRRPHSPGAVKAKGGLHLMLAFLGEMPKKHFGEQRSFAGCDGEVARFGRELIVQTVTGEGVEEPMFCDAMAGSNLLSGGMTIHKRAR